MANDNPVPDRLYATIAPPVGACAMSYTSASTGNSSLTLTIPRPESPVGATSIEGNLLLASIDLTIPNYTPLTVPTGWTLAQTTVIDNPGNNKDLTKLTYYKVATNNEPASYTWSFGNPTKSSGGIICIETGSSSYSVISKNDYPTSTTNITSTGVTTTAVNTLIFGLFVSAHGNDTFTPPATWTSLYSTNTGGSSGSTSLAIAKAFPTAGATGSFTVNTTQSVPRTVHTIGVLCRPRLRAQASATAKALTSLTAKVNNVFNSKSIFSTASASEVASVKNIFIQKTINVTATSNLTAEVNNVFQSKTINVTATSNLTAEVNNVFQPGALASIDTSVTFNPVVNDEDGGQIVAVSEATSGSLVNNQLDPAINIFSTAQLSNTSIVYDIAYSEITSTAISELSTTVNNEATINEVVAISNISLTAEVNNTFVSDIIESTGSSSTVSKVNNVFQPGALALINTVTTLNPLLNGIGESTAEGVAEANSGSVVNNIFQGVSLYATSTILGLDTTITNIASGGLNSTAEANVTALVNNKEILCAIVAASVASCAAITINESINGEVSGLAIVELTPEIQRTVSSNTEIFAVANVALSKAVNPYRPVRSVSQSLNPAFVEADPVIRLI